MGILELRAEVREKQEGETRQRVTLTCLSEMRGTFHNVPLPPDIDLGRLEGELGYKPRFVTLPIGQRDARSRNERTYRESAVQALVNQINRNRPEGNWGHTPDDRMGTEYNPPALRWYAAAMDANGVAWGKALPLTAEADRYYRVAAATNARVGTSLQAWVDMDDDGNVTNMELIKLDAADPARVGIPMTAATPHISTEMLQLPGRNTEATEQDATGEVIEDNPAADGGSESTIEPETLSETTEESMPTQTEMEQVVQINTLKQTVAELEGTIKRQKQAVEDVGEIRTLLKVDEQADLVKTVRGLQEQYAELAGENASLLSEAMESMIEKKVLVPSVRPMVAELVKSQKPITKKQLERVLDEVLARESVKALLTVQLNTEMGGALPKPNNSQPADKLEDYLQPKPEGVTA